MQVTACINKTEKQAISASGTVSEGSAPTGRNASAANGRSVLPGDSYSFAIT